MAPSPTTACATFPSIAYSMRRFAANVALYEPLKIVSGNESAAIAMAVFVYICSSKIQAMATDEHGGCDRQHCPDREDVAHEFVWIALCRREVTDGDRRRRPGR